MDDTLQSLILLHISRKRQFFYIIWTHSHRVTLGNYHPSERKYTFHTARKQFNSLKRRTYIYETTHYVLPKSPSSDGGRKAKPYNHIYYRYDGSSLEPYDEGKGFLSLMGNLFQLFKSDFHYKEAKYHNELVSFVKDRQMMERWLRDPECRAQMAYKTLKFLLRSKIYPDASKADSATTRFSSQAKKLIKERWKADKTNILKLKNGLVLTRDAVGLWVLDGKDKNTTLVDRTLFDTYDIEHVVSNKFGVDNEDVENGILLDKRVNRGRKGFHMLLLVDDVVRQKIWELRKAQEAYMKGRK